MGIDLGTTGVRIVLIDKKIRLIYSASINYETDLEECLDWQKSCEKLIIEIPYSLKKSIKSCSIDGTSGTLVACNYNGKPIGKAIPYYKSYPIKEEYLLELKQHSSYRIFSSLGRAFKLIDKYGEDLLLRHQADWVANWMSGNWNIGEEGNNLKLGWDISTKTWPILFQNQSWFKTLPKIIPSGQIIGKINNKLSKKLDLEKDLLIVAGTTDSNASVIAAQVSFEDGVTVLGSTIVLKKFTNWPIYEEGITNHLVNEKWLCGGSSNTGGRILKRFFSDDYIKELSNQINPNIDSGIKLLPLPCKGERFPTNNPNLQPILEPRPISDSLYLHALFEGLAEIEKKGWKKLINLGMIAPKKIITIGKGANNFKWQKIRQRIIGIPIRKCKKPPAIGAAIIALKGISF